MGAEPSSAPLEPQDSEVKPNWWPWRRPRHVRSLYTDLDQELQPPSFAASIRILPKIDVVIGCVWVLSGLCPGCVWVVTPSRTQRWREHARRRQAIRPRTSRTSSTASRRSSSGERHSL